MYSFLMLGLMLLSPPNDKIIDRVEITKTPATMTFGLPEQKRKFIERAVERKDIVRLSLMGVRFIDAKNVGIRVFLNKTDATIDTPITDDHYVGNFTHGQIPVKVFGHHLNLVKTLSKLKELNKIDLSKDDISITFVAVPLQNETLSDNVRIIIQDVHIHVSVIPTPKK